MEISVFLIVDLPKYHFLHQTEDNPSFDYFDVLVSHILLLKFFQKMNNLKMNLIFLTNISPKILLNKYTRTETSGDFGLVTKSDGENGALNLLEILAFLIF